MTFTLHRLRKVNPAQAVFSQFKLNNKAKVVMFLRKLVVAQFAALVASSAYYIPTQTQLTWSAPKANAVITQGYLGDTWDRLPVHIQNLLHYPVFGMHGQAATLTWITARHDTRHLLIGLFGAIMIGAYTVSLKAGRKRRSTWGMIASVPLAFLAAGVVGAPLIWVATHFHFGVNTSSAYLNQWVGTGMPVLIVGILAGFAAHFVLAGTFDTLQLIALEKRQANGDVEKWWWKIVYPETYRNRYDLLINEGHVPEKHGKLMGTLMALSTPVLLFMAGFGAWNLYFGFASAAGH